MSPLRSSQEVHATAAADVPVNRRSVRSVCIACILLEKFRFHVGFLSSLPRTNLQRGCDCCLYVTVHAAFHFSGRFFTGRVSLLKCSINGRWCIPSTLSDHQTALISPPSCGCASLTAKMNSQRNQRGPMVQTLLLCCSVDIYAVKDRYVDTCGADRQLSFILMAGKNWWAIGSISGLRLEKPGICFGAT